MLLLFAAPALFSGVIWFLWVRPKPVDMAQFAPANSLLYLEANHPAEVLFALAKTDAWKSFIQSGDAPSFSDGGLSQRLLRITGVGPIDSVLMARSQVAVVVTDFGARESGDTLNVKPEAAMIVETHTSERRIRAPIERRLEMLVSATYVNPQVARSVVDGVTIVEWRETNGSGQLVAAFFGSVVIIGNSRRVVEKCLAVARRGAPSLRSSPELYNARLSHDAADALVFGYVPAQETPKLFSAGIPILLRQASTDPQFQRLVQNAAAKVIGTLTWTSRPFRGGIEDRYHIGLQQEVVDELRPEFGQPQQRSPSALSTDFFSISEYRLEDPLGAWQGLRTSISRRVDTVAAVVFNTTLRTSLTTYGIETAEIFLGAVKSPLNTVRLDQDGERQLLVAKVGDRAALAKLFSTTMRERTNSTDTRVTIMENAEGTLSTAVDDSLVVLGHPVDVQHYYRIVRESTMEGSKHPSQILHFVDSADRAHVVTYTNDVERVRGCMGAIMQTYQREFPADWETRIAAFPYAATQITLTEKGLTRVTRSPLGQFGSIIPLLLPARTQPTMNSHD